MRGFFYQDTPPNAASITLKRGPELRDDFETSGNLNGRTNWTAQTLAGFASQINSISAANGAAGGTTGTAAYASVVASVPRAVVQRRMGVGAFTARGISSQFVIDGSGYQGLGIDSAYNVSAGVPTGLVTLRRYTNTSPTTITSFGERIEAGDVVREVYSLSGSDTQLTVLVNGWQIGAAATVSGFGFSMTGRFGLIGNVGAATLEDLTVSDPPTQDWIGLRMAGRVLPVASDGSVTVRVRGTYNLTAPARLLYTLFDRSTGVDVAVTGHNGVALSGFTASGGEFSGTFSVASAALSSGGPFVVRVRRDRMVAGTEAFAFSPRWRKGHVILQNGQSLGVSASSQTQTTSPTYTAPANSFHISGRPTDAATLGLSYTRRQYPIGNDTTAAAFAQAFSGVSGLPVTLASGGVSATNIATRAVGTACHNAILEALERAGGACSMIRHTDGQSDIGDSVTAYIATLQAIYDDIESRMGSPVKVLLNPIAASWRQTGAHDIRWQLMRRTHWLMTQNFPTRYLQGANTLDIQHFDALHLTANGYGEMCRREAHAALRALGLQAHGRNGPSLASVTKISATEIRCVYDLNGFDSLTLVNTGYASNYNGGMIFSTAPTLNATTIATKIAATGATVDASPTGTQQGINFTFPASTFTGSAYVWAAWGQNPFNPADNATLTDPVNLDFAGKASMIQGVKSGEPNVALRPYFTGDGLDYMVAA